MELKLADRQIPEGSMIIFSGRLALQLGLRFSR